MLTSWIYLYDVSHFNIRKYSAEIWIVTKVYIVSQIYIYILYSFLKTICTGLSEISLRIKYDSILVLTFFAD